MDIQKKLDELKEATRKNISNKKIFDFELQKIIPEDQHKVYYEKYLRKATGEQVQKIKIKPRRPGDKDTLDFNITPIHNYNTLLAMAFTKAEQLYSSLRKSMGTTHSDVQPGLPSTDDEMTSDNVTSLSGIECLVLSRYFMKGRNKELETSIKLANSKLLTSFMKNEKLIFRTLRELRNYHAHIFHEPGPVSFNNLYSDEYKPEKKLTQEEWQTARNWFMFHFEDVKQQTLKSLNKQLEQEGITDKEKENINRVINKLINYQFKDGEYVSAEALLFIACFFLRKSDADYFVRKWVGAKNPEGPYKSTQNFFKHFTLKDSKSISVLNEELEYFRKIVSILSTMPWLKTKSLSPFYEYINTSNDEYAVEIKKLEANKRNPPSKRKIETLRDFMIPLRKSSNYTFWYLKYLQKNKMLDGFRLAYYKMPEDREAFNVENNLNNRLEEFKAEMKAAKGGEKRKLTEIYKETKRNFIFKQPSDSYDNYCTKKENALAEYDYKKADGSIVTIKLTLSPDLLMKWVFAEMYFGRGNDLKKNIISFIQKYHDHLSEGKPLVDFSFYDLEYRKLMPSSLTKTVDNTTGNEITPDKVKKIIGDRIEKLERFNYENLQRKAPWKYNAKRKIDIIFDYAHLVYTSNAFEEKKDENTRRHEALNDVDYLKAFEFIRFYGKNYDLPEFQDFFYAYKSTYFSSINSLIKKSTSLEGLYNSVIEKYIEYLHTITKNLAEDKLAKCKVVFKLYGSSKTSEIPKHAALFSTNQSIPPEIINIRKIAESSPEFKAWKKTVKNEDWTTDYSLMRFFLSKDYVFTNTDYLMQEIMPLLLKEGKMDYKTDGKLKGNRSMFTSLVKNKTDELMLWQIANYFFKTHSTVYYNKRMKPLSRNTGNKMSVPYKKANPFSQIMNEELEIKVQRDKAGKNDQVYTVLISPKKFDDEYKYYEQSHIVDYIELYGSEKDKVNGVWSYKEINKNLKNKIAGYLDDVFLLLTVEKYVVQNNFETLASGFKIDGTGNKLPAYYFPFGSVEDSDKELPGNLISRLIFNEISSGKHEFEKEDLIIYRNKVFHQQLQPDPAKYLLIKKALLNFCIQHKLLSAKNERKKAVEK